MSGSVYDSSCNIWFSLNPFWGDGGVSTMGEFTHVRDLRWGFSSERGEDSKNLQVLLTLKNLWF